MAFARAANTGVSGFIDPSGKILLATPIFTEQAIAGTIPLGAPSTFYTRFGDVFAWTCVIISLFLVLFTRFFRKPSRGRDNLSIPFTTPTKKGVRHA